MSVEMDIHPDPSEDPSVVLGQLEERLPLRCYARHAVASLRGCATLATATATAGARDRCRCFRVVAGALPSTAVGGRTRSCLGAARSGVHRDRGGCGGSTNNRLCRRRPTPAAARHRRRSPVVPGRDRGPPPPGPPGRLRTPSGRPRRRKRPRGPWMPAAATISVRSWWKARRRCRVVGLSSSRTRRRGGYRGSSRPWQGPGSHRPRRRSRRGTRNEVR
mmetsp:Transcript_8112/g.20143  ORF Transcript_8112/g.20143 Transcript_8112/m.20143 type:complete len:219 (+) Transcript_8112:569-1225(+)